MMSMEHGPIAFRQALVRGWRRRCPRCGEGPLFGRWNHLRECCPICGLEYEPLEGNSWWFMYYSTAMLTGVIVILMFLIRPANLWLGRLVVFATALVLIVLSLPYRKGIALAIDYLSEHRCSKMHKADTEGSSRCEGEQDSRQ